jgi:hypothetical protein
MARSLGHLHIEVENGDNYDLTIFIHVFGCIQLCREHISCNCVFIHLFSPFNHGLVPTLLLSLGLMRDHEPADRARPWFGGTIRDTPHRLSPHTSEGLP